MLEALNIPTKFYKGLRITTKEAVEVVQMVLTGKINKDIVSQLNSLGAKPSVFAEGRQYYRGRTNGTC